MKLCFLVGSMAISGGTYVIIQHAAYLQDLGHEVTLASQAPITLSMLGWHDRASQLRCISFEKAKAETFDLVIATWWKTALELGQFDARRYAYFVQSIESRFYPDEEGPLRALVDSTYKLPISYITEATWIRDYLSEKFGQTAALVRNGIRKDVYRRDGMCIADPAGRQPRVLIEGHFGVSFKNTALALRLARDAGARDVWVLTGSPVRWLPGASRVFSQVPVQQTAEIYRSCDILIKLSTVEGMFGPPLEIFHCGGTAVVYNVTGHEEYIIDGLNACVIPRGNNKAVVKTISELLTDRDKLESLKNGALKTAYNWPSWEQSSEEFSKWVQATCKTAPTDRAVLSDLSTKANLEYGHDEQARLSKNPSIIRRAKWVTFVARLPSSTVQLIKQLQAAGEVIFCNRETG